MNTLEYKGYHGSVEIGPDDDVLHGKLLFIQPLITYEGETLQKLRSAFKEAVESYVSDCTAAGGCSGDPA